MSNETLCHAEEVAAGQRFEFGKNWQLFLKSLLRSESAGPRTRSVRCSA